MVDAIHNTPAKAALSPVDYGVDGAAFDATYQLLGAKLSTILSYYLEDAQAHIERIAECVERKDASGAMVPAHTLKSSSRQLGANLLAELADWAEVIARTTADIEEVAALVPEMRKALSQVRIFFKAACEDSLIPKGN